MVEIGSEFWEASDTGRKKYLISGRAALEYIIRDILAECNAGSVLMPSYCCHTMLEPFVRHRIKIRFYDVFYDKDKGLSVELPEESVNTETYRNEIFYYMTYFGFSQLSGIEAEKIRERFDLVIEDRTHSWLSIDPIRSEVVADYTFTSFRKWTGVYGIAEARKMTSAFIVETGNIGKEYTIKRKDAMALKAEYISRQKILEKDNALPFPKIDITQDSKKVFLEKFSDAERCLDQTYIGYTPNSECAWQFLHADWDFLIEQRRKNADVLIQGLKEIQEVTLLFKNRTKTDTPIFVPILVEDGRDRLRDYLIKNQVYCPVHWPLSEYHQGLSDRARDIYNKELSIICDQRYTKKEMKFIVCLIKDYFTGRKEG